MHWLGLLLFGIDLALALTGLATLAACGWERTFGFGRSRGKGADLGRSGRGLLIDQNFLGLLSVVECGLWGDRVLSAWALVPGVSPRPSKDRPKKHREGRRLPVPL